MILPDDIDEKLEIWVGETDSEASDSESDLSDHETKSTRHHRHSHSHSHSRPRSSPLSRRHSNGRPASASAPELDSKRDLCRDAERKQRRSRTKDDGQVRRLVLGNGLEVKVGRRSAGQGQTHANGKGKGESDNVFILRKQLGAVTANSNANANKEESRLRHPQYPPGLGLDLGLGLERGHNERTTLPPKKSHVKSETEHTHLHRQPYTHAHTHTHGHTHLHPHIQTHEKSTSTSTSHPLPRSRRPGPIGLGLDLLSNVARPSRLFTSKTRSSSSLRSQRDVSVAATEAVQAAQVHVAAAATHNEEEATIMSATSTSATVARVKRRYSMESIDSSVRGSPRRSSSRVHVSDNDAAAIEGHEKNEQNGVSFSTGEIARESESEVPIGVTGGPGILQQVRAWAWQLWTPSPSSSSHL